MGKGFGHSRTMSSVEGLGVMLLRVDWLTDLDQWCSAAVTPHIQKFKSQFETISSYCLLRPPQLTSGYLSSNSSSSLGVSVKSIPDYVYSQLSSPQVTSPEAKKLLQEIYSTSQRGNVLLINSSVFLTTLEWASFRGQDRACHPGHFSVHWSEMIPQISHKLIDGFGIGPKPFVTNRI